MKRKATAHTPNLLDLMVARQQADRGPFVKDAGDTVWVVELDRRLVVVRRCDASGSWAVQFMTPDCEPASDEIFGPAAEDIARFLDIAPPAFMHAGM